MMIGQSSFGWHNLAEGQLQDSLHQRGELGSP